MSTLFSVRAKTLCLQAKIALEEQRIGEAARCVGRMVDALTIAHANDEYAMLLHRGNPHVQLLRDLAGHLHELEAKPRSTHASQCRSALIVLTMIGELLDF
jgi:hypothetical protein